MKSIILLKTRLLLNFLPFVGIFTGMALFFVFIFSSGFTSEYIPSVYVIDEDGTESSDRLVELLMASKSFHIEEKDYETAMVAMEEKSILSAIHISKGFEEGLFQEDIKVIMYKNSDNVESITLKSMVESEISTLTSNMMFSKTVSEAFKNTSIEVEEKQLYQDVIEEQQLYPVNEVVSEVYNSETTNYNSAKHYFSGFLIFFSLFTIMFGIGTIVEEKQSHSWSRQMVSPLRGIEIMVGNLIVNFILGLLQMIVIVLAGKYFFGVEWGGSIWALLLVLASFTMAGTALGLFITGFVKTEQQLSALLPTIIVSTSMIGGCMWPIDIIQSKVLLFIANLTPQRWAMSGMNQVLNYNGGVAEVLTPTAYLLIITVVFLILSLIPYKFVSRSD